MDTDNQQNMTPAAGGLLQQTQQQCQEVVKRKTKRHEYVEVDGFHFRRKRRTPPTPLANAAAANSAAAAAAAAGCGAGASPAKQSPAGAAAVKHSLQLDDAAQPSPAKASPAPPAADTDAGMADQDAAAGAAAEAAAAQEDAPAPDAAAGVDAAAAGTDGGDTAAPHTAASQQAAAAAAEAAQLAAAAAQAAAAAAAAQAAAEDLEMVEASDDEPAEEEGQGPDSGPVQFSMLPSELCHLVGCFLAAELQKLTPFSSSPASARQAADSIRQQLEQRLLQQRQEAGGAAAVGEGGEGQQGGVGAGQEVPPLTVLPYQVEELKAKLVDKHSKLLQEQEAWMQLLAQYNTVAGTAQGDGAAPQEQQDTAGASTPAADTGDAPADGPMTDAAEQDAAGAEVVVAEEETAAAAAAAPAEAGAVEGPVCAEQQESVLGVQLKVEVLTALVSKMEHLVGRAEATARALQAGYRAEKFGIFPHVDSPAALIKSLAGRGSQAAGTQAGSQGV